MAYALINIKYLKENIIIQNTFSNPFRYVKNYFIGLLLGSEKERLDIKTMGTKSERNIIYLI